jgi:SAM-dependent methyltransferase/uncharacterized membrane protein YbhN (UPF0104 family)
MAIPGWFKKRFYQIASLVLSIVVVYIAIRQGRELLDALRQISLYWAFAGLGFYGLNYLLRSLRLRIILKNRIPMWPDAVHTACLHGLATYMLPFRSGDFTLPVILKKNFNIKFADGAVVLIKARLLDLCALGAWMVTAAVLIDFSIPVAVHRAWLVLGVGLMGLPLLLQWGIKEGRRLPGKMAHKLSDWGRGASIRLSEVCISLGVWACVGACFFCTARAIGLPLGIMQAWLLVTIQLPLQLLPLQGVANAGNHEGGWIAALTLLGIPADQALHFALLSHALIMIYVLTLGPVALLVRKRSKTEGLPMLNPSNQLEQTNYSQRLPFFNSLLYRFINNISNTLVKVGASTTQGIDAGCGEGHMLGHLHAKGVLGSLVAVDVSQTHLAYATEHYPHFDYLAADLNHLPFRNHSFDYVISTEVFEHLDDPDSAMVELRRIAKKGASLIISVPFEPFFHWGNIVRGKYWRRGGYTPDHKNLWRRHDFKRFIEPYVHIDREYGWKSFPWLLFVGRFR